MGLGTLCCKATSSGQGSTKPHLGCYEKTRQFFPVTFINTSHGQLLYYRFAWHLKQQDFFPTPLQDQGRGGSGRDESHAALEEQKPQPRFGIFTHPAGNRDKLSTLGPSARRGFQKGLLTSHSLKRGKRPTRTPTQQILSVHPAWLPKACASQQQDACDSRVPPLLIPSGDCHSAEICVASCHVYRYQTLFCQQDLGWHKHF